MVSCHFVFPCEAKVIPVYDGSSDLLSVVMEETGGLGVDIVVDSGGTFFFLIVSSIVANMLMCAAAKISLFFFYEVRLQEEEELLEEMKLLPHKHDIISVLGVGGHWVTSHKDLQVTHKLCKNKQNMNQTLLSYFNCYLIYSCFF